jgi:hypothetical protein
MGKVEAVKEVLHRDRYLWLTHISLSVALLCTDLIIMEKEIGLVSGRRIVSKN